MSRRNYFAKLSGVTLRCKIQSKKWTQYFIPKSPKSFSRTFVTYAKRMNFELTFERNLRCHSRYYSNDAKFLRPLFAFFEICTARSLPHWPTARPASVIIFVQLSFNYLHHSRSKSKVTENRRSSGKCKRWCDADRTDLRWMIFSVARTEKK